MRRRKADRSSWLSRMLGKPEPSEFPVLEAVHRLETDFPCPQCGEKARRKDTYCKHCGMLLGVPVFIDKQKGPLKLPLPYYALLILCALLLAVAYWTSNPGTGGGNTSADSNLALFGLPAVSFPNLKAGEVSADDLRSYIAELQRRIYERWSPTEENLDKTVIVLFRISQGGQLLSYGVQESSGIKKVDAGALAAVKAAAPYPPLPAGYTASNLDVQVIFDKGLANR